IGPGTEAIKAGAQLINQARPKDVRLVYGKYLPQKFAVIAEAGDRISISTGLGVKCPVGIVVTVQLISGADVIADIAAPLVRIDGGPGRADEARRAGGIKKVS